VLLTQFDPCRQKTMSSNESTIVLILREYSSHLKRKCSLYRKTLVIGGGLTAEFYAQQVPMVVCIIQITFPRNLFVVGMEPLCILEIVTLSWRTSMLS
jgi:hypothetical protein